MQIETNLEFLIVREEIGPKTKSRLGHWAEVAVHCELLLHLKLRIDDIVLLAVAGGAGLRAAGLWTAAAGALRSGAALPLDMLRQRVRCRLQVVQRLLDGVQVGAAGGLLDLLDGGLDRRLVALGELVGV